MLETFEQSQQIKDLSNGNSLHSQPVYVLPQAKKRAIIPKIMTLISLSFIFYLGILLNISFLDLTAKEETIVKTISLLFLLFLIILGTFLTIKQANKNYTFYAEKINFKNQNIAYLNINNTLHHQDFFDKIFNTYSINLGENFHLRHLTQEIKIQDYLNQMINYNKKNDKNA